MSADPTNWASLDELAEHLMAGHDSTLYVQLQPGDGTRYDLLLTPLHNTSGFLPGWGADDLATLLLVTIIRDGTDLRSCYVLLDDISRLPLKVLADGNGWTLEFLTWWFQQLSGTIRWDTDR